MMRDRLLLGTPVAVLAVLAMFAAAFMLHQTPRSSVTVALVGLPDVNLSTDINLSTDVNLSTDLSAGSPAQALPVRSERRTADSSTSGSALDQEMDRIRQNLDSMTVHLQDAAANPAIVRNATWRSGLTATADDLRQAGNRMQMLRWQPENAALDLLALRIARHLQHGGDALDVVLSDGPSSRLLETATVEYTAARSALDQIMLRLQEK